MLTVSIKTSNAATEFPEDVAELVRGVADRIAVGSTSGAVIDYNGNKVGTYEWSDK